MTDAEVALILIHEYFHSKQGDAYIALINEDPSLRKQIYDTYGELSSDTIGKAVDKLVDEDRQAFNIDFGGVIANAGEEIGAHNMGLRTTDLYPAEAQANTGAYYILNQLNLLNDSTHLPGTSFQDPGQRQIAEIRMIQLARSEIPNFDSLYKLCNQTAFASQNALDPRWLIFGSQ
jgi:hypothetical protein